MLTLADMSIKVERTSSSSTDFPTSLDKPSTSSCTSEVVSKKLHVNKIPFRVKLTRLTQIEKFTGRPSTDDYTGTTSAYSDIGLTHANCVTGTTRAQQRVKKTDKKLIIRVRKLPISPKQSVVLSIPSVAKKSSHTIVIRPKTQKPACKR